MDPAWRDRNNLLRETKQDWYLEDSPKKTREGVFFQVYKAVRCAENRLRF
jgi:hypothetical protein